MRLNGRAVWTVGLVCVVAGVAFSVAQSNWVWLVVSLVFGAAF